jgi:hypothetical protein
MGRCKEAKAPEGDSVNISMMAYSSRAKKIYVEVRWKYQGCGLVMLRV